MSKHAPVITQECTDIHRLTGETVFEYFFIKLECLDCDYVEDRDTRTPLQHVINCEEIEKLALEHAQRSVATTE